jgi:pimeloyl-ACP methyl ester carboxylesterase/DNA-binding CsgD family transcriptional regulator
LIPFRQDVRFARTTDPLRIAYAISGHGYPLVRAGTWMSNIEFDWRMAVFGPLFRELSARYRLYRYNPRGYGLSEGDDAEITVDTLVADLEAVVDDAGLEKFALWGGAAAGSVASIAYAARHPERVTHLVLSAPIARGRLHANSKPEDKERFLAFVKLIELGWGEDNPAFRQILNTQMFPRATPAQMNELNELFRVSVSPRHAARMAMATGRADVSSSLACIVCPTLIMHCRGSVLLPVEEVRLIASSIPHARFVLLESDNYIPLEGEPAFARLVAEFDAFLPGLKEVSAKDAALGELTRREREVLDLVARGLDNNDIATRLAVAEKTVRNTVSHIFDKLSVSSRAQAIVLARQAGLGD